MPTGRATDSAPACACPPAPPCLPHCSVGSTVISQVAFSATPRPLLLQPPAAALVALMTWTTTALLSFSFPTPLLLVSTSSRVTYGLLLLESIGYGLSVLVVLKTYYDGRPGHTPSSERTHETDSLSDPYAVDFIQWGVGPTEHLSLGRLGMGVLPGRFRPPVRRDLAVDLERLVANFAIEAVVTLNPPDQLAEMKVPDLAARIRARGLDCMDTDAWRDKWWPSTASLDRTLHTVSFVLNQLRSQKNVLVHCNGGKGRTGLVVVAVLLTLGMSLPQAVDAVRRARKGCIHNPSQLLYLGWFAAYVAAQRRAPAPSSSSSLSSA
jgi:hypothetical protein